ncbi:HD domain-containing protein [Paenibacillus sp. QZ-Y1]|uniref:HD domain-containing protein n=1 Tax=Paenibacillus sp. QZ-Y1 TaxID=3414511 RepID=UPI003F79EC35
MPNLNVAIKIAAEAHMGQFDKAGDPYILHPLRVMMHLNTEAERIVGVLHDVLEDTEVNVTELLKQGFSGQVIEALGSVTRRKDETYFDFIQRAKQNEIGRKVKLADLKDNMDWSRIKVPSEEDMKRMQKYQKAYYILMQDQN